jgi:hypothetical protein
MADLQLRARPGKSKGKSPRPDSDIDEIFPKPPKVYIPQDVMYSADDSIQARMQQKQMRKEIREKSH